MSVEPLEAREVRRAATPRMAGGEIRLTWLRRGAELSAAVKLAAMEIPEAAESVLVNAPEHRMLIGDRGAGGKPGLLAAGG